jgi:hypothetical protein
VGEPRSRDNLERSLYEVPKEVRRYRAWLAYFFTRALVIGVILTGLGVLFKQHAIGVVGLFTVLLSAILAPLGWLFEKFGSRRRLDVSGTKFVLDHGAGRVETYELAKVEHVRLVWIPYLYAKLKIHMVDGRTLSLRPQWDRFDYVLDALHHAQPELTSFARFERFRIHCIANDHRRTRNAQQATPRRVGFLILKFVGTPILATAVFLPVKAMGLGVGVIPTTAQIFSDAFMAAVVMWGAWAIFEEMTLHRAQVKKLLVDPKHVRRDILEETKFKHTFGMESWMAFWMVLAVACLTAAIGLS